MSNDGVTRQETNQNRDRDVQNTSQKHRYLSGPLVFAVTLVFYASIGVLVQSRINSFPEPKTVQASVETDFVEERARGHLIAITDFGPRVAGSAGNNNAEKYILQELDKIIKTTRPVHDLSVDVQTVSGSFVLDFIGVGEFTSVYSNVDNVIAKLSPKGGANHSVLINCHYDTVTDSPGASDDAVSCCLMIEILRALSQNSTPLQHSIVFLFNGAEENILQASHGFITKHQWAKDIRTFVNLDSAGAGGWELVFQTGPEHPWLVRAYVNSAKYPCASAISQEIFQNGLVPSDTDYRVFRDYGKLPGLDIAHVKNGYVYHTLHDTPDMVEPGCLQRGGENLLELLKTLASSPEVVDPGADKHGNMVFFDFIGYFMISYPQRVGVLINSSIAGIVFLGLIKHILGLNGKGSELTEVLLHLAGAILSVICTWLAVLLSSVCVAVFLSLIGREMTWYTHVHNVILLFAIPGVTGGLGFNLLLKKTVYKNWDPWKIESLFYEANLVVWACVLAILTYYNIMSGYLILLWVLFPVLVRSRTGKLMKLDLSANPNTYLLISFATIAVPAIYTIYITYACLHFFIPIMGRVGMFLRSDIPVSIITVFPVIICTAYQASLVYVCKRIGYIIGGLAAVSFVAVLLVVFTSLGFPFASDRSQSSLQRTIFMHIDRRFHDLSGAVLKEDSSIWYIPFDKHGPKSLMEQTPIFKDAKPVTCEGTYCGRPYLYPILPLIDATKCLDLPAPLLKINPRLSAKMTKREKLLPDKVRLSFRITGPDHMNGYISPRPGVNLTWWSVGSGIPNTIRTLPEITQPTYFLYHAHGEESPHPWEFLLEFYVDETKEKNEPIVDVAFAGHYLHGEKQKTSELKQIFSKLPPWTVSNGWACTYDMYEF